MPPIETAAPATKPEPVIVTGVPPAVVPEPGVTDATIGPVPAVTVKFGREIAKKMFPTQATLIRAVAVARFGTEMACVPSFGVEARIVVGNVMPPSFENVSATFAHEIGAAVVPATFHVTVWDDPPTQETAVEGAVTAKAAPVSLTWRTAESKSTPPPPDLPSRAVRRNVSVRVIVGEISP